MYHLASTNSTAEYRNAWARELEALSSEGKLSLKLNAEISQVSPRSNLGKRVTVKLVDGSKEDFDEVVIATNLEGSLFSP